MRRRREREGGGETRREEEKNRRGREDCWHDHTGIPASPNASKQGCVKPKRHLDSPNIATHFLRTDTRTKSQATSKKPHCHALVFVDCGSLFFSDRVCPTCQPGWVFSLPLPPPFSRRRGKEKSLGGREKGRPGYVSAVVCTCCVEGVGRRGRRGCLTDMRVEGGWACGRKFTKVLYKMGIDGTEMCHA